MSKGLDAFSEVLEIISCRKHNDKLQDYIDITVNELTALDIIISKKVNIGYFIRLYKDKSYNEYHYFTQFTIGKQISEIPLIKEEFDLLKEVLL